MAISSPGIGSNLDVNGIISKLMQVEQQPLTVLDTREASYQAQLSAYGNLKGGLSTFLGSLQSLNNPEKYKALSLSSTDSTVATGSATSIASVGKYDLNVSKIAQAQKLVAAGQTSVTAAIGSGTSTTLTFDFGTISGGTFTAYDPVAGTGGTYSGASFASNGSGVKTVTIDASNNSLSGVRDAINAAKIGVKASIVNDGGTSPYRLVLSAETAGASNSLKVSVSGDASISALLAHDPAGTQNLRESITSQNTELTVDGVFVSKASTSLTDVIQGVTLNVLKTGAATVTVARDTSAVSTAVTGFVKAYNELDKTLKSLSTYNAETKRAAVLQGDAAVRSIQSQLRSMLTSRLSGTGAYSSLSQVGVSFQKDGTLAVDTAKLQAALDAKASDVASLFAATGSASDSLVSFVGATANTQPGTYALTVTQLATQGKVQGSQAANLTITSGVNDALTVSVDGVTTSLTLTAKTYTAQELAMELQSKINGSSAFSSAGIAVVVTQAAGALTVTSRSYGSASSVTVSGTGADDLLGAARASTSGVDVAGTINGAAAIGSGQILTGASGNAAVGLKVQISDGATGLRGTVSYSRGYAYLADKLVNNLLNNNGTISSRTDGINRSIKDIENRREVLTRRLQAIEARYRAQYTALDTMLSQMNQTSNYLTQQLAKLS